MANSPAPLPPSFRFEGESVVFVRIREARHQLVFDLSAAEPTLHVVSNLAIRSEEAGLPVVDLAPGPARTATISVDGKPVGHREIRAPRSRPGTDRLAAAAFFRVLDELQPGDHHVRVAYSLSGREARGVRWATGPRRATCLFGMSDFVAADRRHFLERYLPANPEYDQHPVRVDVQIAGTAALHTLIANGVVTGDLINHWRVEYPDWYSASCPFLFFGPKDEVPLKDYAFPRAGSGILPVTIFADRGSDDFSAYERVLHEKLPILQADFGPFPHAGLLVMARSRGMEYAGAVSATPGTLFHELAHCYFGRSLLPRDGDAGWIDESIANWYTARRRGSPPPKVPEPKRRRNMGAVSPYRRGSAGADGRVGMMLLRYLDWKLNGGLLAVLGQLHAKYAKQTLATRELQAELRQIAGLENLDALFDRCVYGVA